MDEIIFDDEIPCGNEIRLDGGWVDLISSAKQISSGHRSDFIVLCAISLKSDVTYDIISFKEVVSVAENKLADISTEFAIQILRLDVEL